MKAARVERFGGPETIAVVEVDTPEPGPGQVLVRVAACGLNYSDVLARQGVYVGGPKPPYLAGIEAAGVIERTGPGVADPAREPGSRVMLIAERGAHATHVVVAAGACMPLPDGVSFERGAAFGVSYLTAYHALDGVARARAGETVLIQAAGGGLGTAAVQIALALGLRVIATASTEGKRTRVRGLGAHHVCGPGELALGEKFDLILQTMGGRSVRDSLRRLRPGGRMVLCGFTGAAPQPIDPVALVFRSQTVSGFHLRSLLDHPDRVAADLEPLLAWLAAGTLVPQVGATFGLAAIRDAHRSMESRERYGKVVLIP